MAQTQRFRHRSEARQIPKRFQSPIGGNTVRGDIDDHHCHTRAAERFGQRDPEATCVAQRSGVGNLDGDLWMDAADRNARSSGDVDETAEFILDR